MARFPALPSYSGPPVVVIGNGPVGQSAALLLARWGIGSIVLDARPERDLVGSKSICQHRDVLDIWDSVGVGQAIADEGVTWTLARTFYREHELFAVGFPDPGQSVFPPFVNISQGRTEQLLDGQIAQTPLIDVRWNHAVTGLRETENALAVTVSGPAGTSTIETPYAVAAAGARGELRRMLGVGFPGRSFHDHFLICDIRADLPVWERERRFYFDPAWNPGRQVLIHPCPDSTYRIDWQVPAEFDLDTEERTGALEDRIRKIVGDVDYDIVWRSVYSFHSRCADRMRAGRVLLAGDCAHLYAPFGARGLNSGVADAENAAWKIAFVLHGWADDRLLASYDQERHAAALENLDVTTHTMDFLVPQTEEAWQRRRDLLARAVQDPSARADIDSGRLYEPFWYVDSPLTTPDPTRAPASRPARGQAPPPGVGVLVPDCSIDDPDSGERTRLRAVCRDGLVVLVIDRENQAAIGDAVDEVVRAPVRVLAVESLSDSLRAHLGARSGEVWVVRPDATVAAVVPGRAPQDLAGAVRRAVGLLD